MAVTEYYNEANRKMTLLINNTIMTYGKDRIISRERNNAKKSNALRILICELIGSCRRRNLLQ